MNNGCNEDCEDIQTKQTIYLGIDTYMHTITVNKQAMNLTKSRDGSMGGFEGRKRKGEIL